MQKTPLGLTRLAPGEGLATDNYSFQDLNPKIIDGLLQYAAFRHRHDAHLALVNPVASPVAATGVTGGSIASDTAIYVGYTLTDADGGETTLNPDPVVVTTQGGLDTPTDGPDLDVQHEAGTLLAGNYSYALTVTDGLGGETAIGPGSVITIAPGNPANHIVISGLADLVSASGGSGYRLWRRINGGPWGLVASGAADTVNDDGSLCADCKNVSPPVRTGRTNATNTLTVTVPAVAPNTSATSFSIYASLDGSFASPSLLGTYPVADLASAKVFTALDFVEGAPPEESLAMPGAPNVDADTDVINLRVKAPVASASDLPIVDNRDGDLRVTLDDHNLHVWDDTAGAWGNVSTGQAASSQPHVIADEGVAVTQRGTLNFVGSGVTVDDENGQTVVHIDGGGGSGGSGGHIIQDEGHALTQRATLDFVGAGVAVTDDGTRTVVTIPGGGGGTGTSNAGLLGMSFVATEEALVQDAQGPAATPDTITFTLDQPTLVALDFSLETGYANPSWGTQIKLLHNGVQMVNSRDQPLAFNYKAFAYTFITLASDDQSGTLGESIVDLAVNPDSVGHRQSFGPPMYVWLDAGDHTFAINYFAQGTGSAKVRYRRLLAWNALAAGGGGGGGGTADGNGFSRQTLVVNGVGDKNIALPRGYRLLKVVATQPATRVRLYTRADRRAADQARTIQAAPIGADHGLILDAELDANSPLTFTPALEGWNDDDAVTDVGYLRVDATTPGTVTLTYVQTEV